MPNLFNKHMKVYATLQGAEEYVTKGKCTAKRVADDEYRMKLAVPQEAVKADVDGLLTIVHPNPEQ